MATSRLGPIPTEASRLKPLADRAHQDVVRATGSDTAERSRKASSSEPAGSDAELVDQRHHLARALAECAMSTGRWTRSGQARPAWRDRRG